jgi:hypothetical protein
MTTSSGPAGPAPPLLPSPLPHHRRARQPRPLRASACTLAPSRGWCAHAGLALASATSTVARTQRRFPRQRRMSAARANQLCRVRSMILKQVPAQVCSASRSRSSCFRCKGSGIGRRVSLLDDEYNTEFSSFGIVYRPHFRPLLFLVLFNRHCARTYIVYFPRSPHCIYTLICSLLVHPSGVFLHFDYCL